MPNCQGTLLISSPTNYNLAIIEVTQFIQLVLMQMKITDPNIVIIATHLHNVKFAFKYVAFYCFLDLHGFRHRPHG